MKVAFLTHTTVLYGANRSLLNLIDGLLERGVKAFVIVPAEGDITEELKIKSVPFKIIPLKWWVSEWWEKFWSISSFSVKHFRNYYRWRRDTIERLIINLNNLSIIKNQLLDWDIDIIYTNSSVLPSGAWAAKAIGLPHVWHLREFNDLDFGFCFDWGKPLHRFIIGSADAVIAISHAVKSHYTKGKIAGNFHVIYNGVASVEDFNRLKKKSSSQHLPDNPFIFALVGMIQSKKGQDVAIKALSLLIKDYPNLRLRIVGDGNYDHLVNLANSLGITKNIDFTGHLVSTENAYLQSHVVLMCSENEAMGRVTVEAMAASRPVIGYDRAGTSELIEDEKTGLLYVGEEKELAACMKRFVDNLGWARELGDNAWEVARKKYSVETYTENIYNVLTGLVSAPAS